MTPERFAQVESLLHAALARRAESRAAFLDQACGDDSELRREVASLLAAHAQAGQFIESPALEIAAHALATGPLAPGALCHHYKVLAPLGAGGMGEVYLAEDTRLDRQVALKLLPAEFTRDADHVRRFIQEAKAASALNHPNIVTIHDIGESDSGHFIVMELVEGRTLRAVIAEDYSVETLLTLGQQMAEALSAAHTAGITHRDIKPDNMMVRPDGYVKVLDFGLARLLPATAPDASAARQTRSGMVIGTFAYMSPEQARGEAVGHTSDIFSLGIVFYELATGQHPFKAETPVGYLHAITSQTPAPPAGLQPQLPAALNDLILRMLDKEASRRPTAGEVVRALHEIELEKASGARRSNEVEPANRNAMPMSASLPPAVVASRPYRHTVGRTRERHELRTAFRTAQNGRGSLLCVAGEPGIGKTTLVEASLAELRPEHSFTTARGRCSERLAGTEAYLPLLEALESLLRSDQRMAPLMKQLAPTWYAQIVALSGESEESARLLTEVKAASQERMKRELANFLQEVAERHPLVIFFDDLHWADVSTIDLLNFIAGKLDGLKVLIVTTYRPSDMLLGQHPFLQIKPDLQARGLCRELRLEFLNEAEVAEYLALEFPGHRFPAEFPQLIHAKTEGNPLFMADLVRYLRDRGVIAPTGGVWGLQQTLPDIATELPESVRGMIERKIAQLEPEDRQLLTAASVQGYEFESAVVAPVLKLAADEVEERLEKLERVYAFVKLVDEREYPDHTLTLRYRFVHVLYQNTLYAALRATRKAALSRAVAQTLEAFYGAELASVANELAALYETGREFAKSADYFQLAAGQASQVLAAREAAALARRGLRMIEMLSESRARRAQEFSLRLILGYALMATQGYTAPEVEATFSRAHELGLQLGETAALLPVLNGRYALCLTRGRHRQALGYAEEFLRLAERLQSPAVVVGHTNVGTSLYFLGALEQARDHLQQAVSLYAPALHRPLTWFYGHEPGVLAESFLSWTLWLLGYPDQALSYGLEALRLGREVAHANSQAFGITGAALTHQCCGDWRRAGELAEEQVALAAEQGLPYWLWWATTTRGSAMVERGETAEGLAAMRQGIAAIKSIGAASHLTWGLYLLAEALVKTAESREALVVLAEAQALVKENEERFWQAELCRLKGEVLRADAADAAEVESLFHQAIEIARWQQAKSLELRAVMSLARLWQQQGKIAAARQMLAAVYAWFTEGFDTADLKAANALLDDLSS
ncbi:MAG TPA: protein kinase [Blastocatellia bacterium]|nr:protein kinase [Blastocatellia bacterium]